DSGVLLLPQEVTPAAAAIVRCFIDHGDRTDRKRARQHYLIERWGVERCLVEAAAHLPFVWRSAPLDVCAPRGPIDKHGHIGVHRQSEPGFCYVGVVLPVGRLEVLQLRGLGEIAERYGSGFIRLTVWQNLLISDIPEDRLAEAIAAIETLGLTTSASAIRGGVVACTGNFGCKFRLRETKRDGFALILH